MAATTSPRASAVLPSGDDDTDMPDHPRRAERPRASIPLELWRPFAEIAERRLHQHAYLVQQWMIRAAKRARDGQPLPPAPRPRHPNDEVVPVHRVKWTQHPAEHAECVALIEGAGSSLEAVLHASIRHYIRVDGDLLRLPDW